MSCPCVEEANCPQFLLEGFPSQPSSYRQNSLMSGLAMSNADKRHKHSLLVEKSPHRVAKMLVSGLFLNTYNFKLPRVKISLAPTSLEEKKKKDSGTHMLLVYSSVHLLQQVLCYASNLFLISLTIKAFSNSLSNILLLSVS